MLTEPALLKRAASGALVDNGSGSGSQRTADVGPKNPTTSETDAPDRRVASELRILASWHIPGPAAKLHDPTLRFRVEAKETQPANPGNLGKLVSGALRHAAATDADRRSIKDRSLRLLRWIVI